MENLEPIGRLISYLYRYQRIFLNRELEPYGILSGQFCVMRILYVRAGVRQETLAGILKADKATVARAIKKLEDAGYVCRKQDAEDKRAYNVFVTEKGRALEEKMREIYLKWEETLLSGFSEEEKQLVLAFIKRMEQNVPKVIE